MSYHGDKDLPNAQRPAHPSTFFCESTGPEYYQGLTKRELFAAMAMQGFCANPPEQSDAVDIARFSRCQADALLAELERTNKT